MPLRTDENRFFVTQMKYVGHTQVEYLEVAGRNHATVVDKIPEPNEPVAAAILRFVTQPSKP